MTQSKNSPFVVDITSDSTGTLLSQNICRQMPLLSYEVIVFFSSIVVLTLNGNLWIVPLRNSVSDSSQIIVVGGDRSPYTNRTHTWMHMTVVEAARNRFLLKMLMFVYPVRINPAFKETQTFIAIIVNLPQDVNRTTRGGIA